MPPSPSLHLHGVTTIVGVLMVISSPALAFERSPLNRPTHAGATSQTCPVPPDAKRNALWNLVECCTQSLSADPHCRTYNPKSKYIVAKDASSSKPKAYLAIPTVQIIGIESPDTLKSPTLDLWQSAWNESATYPGHDASKRGLALNSAIARDQDQLHIHLSCVQASVLRDPDGLKTISTDPRQPTKINLTSKKHSYEAVLLKSLTGDSSPFNILRQLPHASDHLKDQSIAVIQGRDRQSFIFLNTYASGSNPGEAEELLDQTCSQ